MSDCDVFVVATQNKTLSLFLFRLFSLMTPLKQTKQGAETGFFFSSSEPFLDHNAWERFSVDNGSSGELSIFNGHANVAER